MQFFSKGSFFQQSSHRGDIMLTRRRFLTLSAASSLVAAAGCRPANFRWVAQSAQAVPNLAPSVAKKADLAGLKDFFLGYPINMNTPPEAFFGWRRELRAAGVGEFAYNNVGNPFKHSPIPFNTHDFECEAILRFGKLYGFPERDVWGFLSHSGTDSNMHGMYMGRTLLKGRSGTVPKCYFTKEAHYSIQILRDLLGLDAVFVATLPDGGMDPADLARKLADEPKRPALVVATVGTTFKGAIDNLDGIREVSRGYSTYLHLDAALFGGYLPHTSHAREVSHRSLAEPNAPRYDSIAVSCHKFFGFPSPAGLFITTQSAFDEFNELYTRIHNPEYIGHVPGTLTCSRDAVKPAEFYFFSTEPAMAKQAKDARAILENTDYLLRRMNAEFAHMLPARANPLSNTIYFKKPSDKIVTKYSLATMSLEIDGQMPEFAHVVIMPHATRNILNAFLADLERD
jgi:histidine decarboxylase